MGISESSSSSVGAMWNSNVLIGHDGSILNHHRKLVPTFYEKLVWASGDGAGLRVSQTQVGRVGNLICGENTNPLARYSLMAQSEQIHISSWPPMWPTRRPGNGGNFNNVAANKIRASAHSFEAKAFGILAAGYMDKPMRDFLLARDPSVADIIDQTQRAASLFVDPTGETVGDFLQNEEGIAYAEFDLRQCIEPKQFHDVVGYYNRFDIFDVTVNRKRLTPASFVDTEIEGERSEFDCSSLDGEESSARSSVDSQAGATMSENFFSELLSNIAQRGRVLFQKQTPLRLIGYRSNIYETMFGSFIPEGRSVGRRDRVRSATFME